MDTLYHWQLVRLLLMLVVALQLVKHRNHFVKRKLEYFDKINSSYDVYSKLYSISNNEFVSF